MYCGFYTQNTQTEVFLGGTALYYLFYILTCIKVITSPHFMSEETEVQRV